MEKEKLFTCAFCDLWKISLKSLLDTSFLHDFCLTQAWNVFYQLSGIGWWRWFICVGDTFFSIGKIDPCFFFAGSVSFLNVENINETLVWTWLHNRTIDFSRGKTCERRKSINLFFFKLLWTSFKSEKLNYMTSFQIKSIVVWRKWWLIYFIF